MPTYEYECTSCKHRFDRLQSITSKTGAACPKCKKKAKRLISAGAGFIFKGTGFYSTDYKKKQGKSQESKPCPPKGCGSDACSKD